MTSAAPLRRTRRPARASIAYLLAAAALALPVWPASGATKWATDPAHSRLTFSATQAGAKFDGRFVKFEPAIQFDAADLGSSRFHVVVFTGSAETRDEERDQTLRGKDFFDAARWDRATYEATTFKALGSNRFEAQGRLTIRNVTRDVRLPFAFAAAPDGRTAALTGGTTIQRLDFGVGQGEWGDTTWVGNPVDIRFELKLSADAPAAH